MVAHELLYTRYCELQSIMERCSTRNHENATADASPTAQDDRAGMIEASISGGSPFDFAPSKIPKEQPQSDMERGSTRDHENATADPSASLGSASG
jgi:hypothetical protein